MTDVQRFVARVKPQREHPRYFEWQTAVVCLFIGDSDRTAAQTRADAEIRRRGWERIEFIERATLIEDRVQREGGAVLEAFLQARNGAPFYLEQLDEIPFATKEKQIPIVAPRLTESFLDQVVLAAGGERLDADQSNPDRPKTADYRVGSVVLELKDLQNESLDVRTRQKKIARLFASKVRPDRSVIIDSEILSAHETQEYLDIVGEPIRKRLSEAGRQVRATLSRSSSQQLRGGVILLNTGYGSVSPEVLAKVAADYIARSSTISIAVCISAWTVTNGFDTVVNFAFDPHEGGDPAVGRLREAFWSEIDVLMTEWGRSGFGMPSDVAEPRRPIVFETEEGIFSVLPPKPPNPVGWPSSADDGTPAT